MKGSVSSKAAVKNWCWGYFFIAPTIIGLLVLNIYPIISTIILSFKESMGLNQYRFLGVDHYIKMLGDPVVWSSLKNTMVFAACTVPVSILISLVLAWMMTRGISRGAAVYRVIYFMPMVVASAAVAMVWSWIFNTEFGVLNALLKGLGLKGVSWLNDPRYAMLSVVVIAIWSSLGQQIIILTVAIKNVPGVYYEAADIDGARGIDKLFKITVPLISPNIFFLTITGFIGALSQFDLIYMLYRTTSSAALDSVQTIMYQYYKQAFVIQDKPYASAIATFTFLIILLLTVLQMMLQKKFVVYE